MPFGTQVVVLMSCIIGIGISISGFMCREAISATSFSVVGNMNKVLTVFINFLVSLQAFIHVPVFFFDIHRYSKMLV